MGYALAEAALRRGARVLLVSGPTAVTPPSGAELTRVESAEEMREAVLRFLAGANDRHQDRGRFRLSSEKIGGAKDQANWRDDAGTRTDGGYPGRSVADERLAADHRLCRRNQNVLENARKKLSSKSLDAIVVNDVSREGVGFDSDRNAVTIITQNEVVEVPETTKWEVAQRVLDVVARLRKPVSLENF